MSRRLFYTDYNGMLKHFATKQRLVTIQNHNLTIYMLCVMLVDNVLYADICAGEEADNAEYNQQNVFDQHPVEAAEARPLVERDYFDQRRED